MPSAAAASSRACTSPAIEPATVIDPPAGHVTVARPPGTGSITDGASSVAGASAAWIAASRAATSACSRASRSDSSWSSAFSDSTSASLASSRFSTSAANARCCARAVSTSASSRAATACLSAASAAAAALACSSASRSRCAWSSSSRTWASVSASISITACLIAASDNDSALKASRALSDGGFTNEATTSSSAFWLRSTMRRPVAATASSAAASAVSASACAASAASSSARWVVTLPSISASAAFTSVLSASSASTWRSTSAALARTSSRCSSVAAGSGSCAPLTAGVTTAATSPRAIAPAMRAFRDTDITTPQLSPVVVVHVVPAPVVSFPPPAPRACQCVSVSVGRPVPRLSREIGEPVVRRVGRHPVVGGAPVADGAIPHREVDGEPLLVHRRPGPGRGRAARRRRHRIDRIRARSAVGHPHRDLCRRVAVTVAAHRDTVLGGRGEQVGDLLLDVAGDLDAAPTRAGHGHDAAGGRLDAGRLVGLGLRRELGRLLPGQLGLHLLVERVEGGGELRLLGPELRGQGRIDALEHFGLGELAVEAVLNLGGEQRLLAQRRSLVGERGLGLAAPRLGVGDRLVLVGLLGLQVGLRGVVPLEQLGVGRGLHVEDRPLHVGPRRRLLTEDVERRLGGRADERPHHEVVGSGEQLVDAGLRVRNPGVGLGDRVVGGGERLLGGRKRRGLGVDVGFDLAQRLGDLHVLGLEDVDLDGHERVPLGCLIALASRVFLRTAGDGVQHRGRRREGGCDRGNRERTAANERQHLPLGGRTAPRGAVACFPNANAVASAKVTVNVTNRAVSVIRTRTPRQLRRQREMRARNGRDATTWAYRLRGPHPAFAVSRAVTRNAIPLRVADDRDSPTIGPVGAAGQWRQNSFPSGSCITAHRWPGWLLNSTKLAPARVTRCTSSSSSSCLTGMSRWTRFLTTLGSGTRWM